MRSNRRCWLLYLALAAALLSPTYDARAKGGAVPMGGLDLTEPAPAAKEKGTPASTPPATPLEIEGLDLSGASAGEEAPEEAADPASAERLALAMRLFNDGSYLTAALGLDALLRDPATERFSALREDARFALSRSLERLGLYSPALAQVKLQLAQGPNARRFEENFEWLMTLGKRKVDEERVLEEVAKWSAQGGAQLLPEAARIEASYLLARYHFKRGRALAEAGRAEESGAAFDEALRAAASVPRTAPLYGRAMFVSGGALFQRGDYPQALEAFKEVVRVNNRKTNPGADQALRELAFLQLARTHYGHEQNRYAIYYYDKISRGSGQWLEALFESSWAHFRVGEYERALGNLITLSSPFFKEEYFPEAHILKAVIYYENCRFAEARAILDAFERDYEPVHAELSRVVKEMAERDSGTWDELAAQREAGRRAKEGGANPRLERVMKLVLTDRELRAASELLEESDRELALVARFGKPLQESELGRELAGQLKAEREALSKRADLLVRAKLESELAQLTTFLSQALRIKFETTTKEKESLESTLSAGASGEELRDYRYSVAVGDERLYWPFEGEYWRDELGTYEYTLTRGCRSKR